MAAESGREPTSGVTLRWPDATLAADQLQSLIGPGAPFELVEKMVAGTPVTLFANRPTSLRDVLIGAAQRMGDRPYLIFPRRTLTFASTLEAVGAVAHRLEERYGVGPGDRVALASASCAEYVLTLWATICLGGVAVALNGWWTGDEMAYGIGLTTPKVVLGDRRRLERLEGIDLGGVPLGIFEEGAVDTEAGGDTRLPEVAIDEEDPCLILFTSGTTGRSKGATLSHRNNIHFGMAMFLGGAESMLQAAAAGATSGGSPDPGCSIAAMPLFHNSGLNGQLLSGAFTGLTTVFPEPGRWREDVHLELTERYRATMWSVVPAQLWRLLEWPDLDRYDLSSVQRVAGGASVWPPELLRTLEERLPGVQRHIGYGATETAAMGTSLKGEATFEHPDSIGQPGPTVELQVRDPASGHVLGEGDVGEICLRTAGIFMGYWEDPEATKAVLDPDGWYHTGDFGYIRQGFVYLGGRRTDLIIRGGENVYPVEVENRLVEHPDIVEAAVVGTPHPTLGQEVKAFVVVRHGAELTDDEVRRFVGAALAAFKVPSHIEWVPALPRNAAGKVLKLQLEQPEQPSRFVPE